VRVVCDTEFLAGSDFALRHSRNVYISRTRHDTCQTQRGHARTQPGFVKEGEDTRRHIDECAILNDGSVWQWPGVRVRLLRADLFAQLFIPIGTFHDGCSSTPTLPTSCSRDYEASNSPDPQDGRAEVSCPAFKRAESAESAVQETGGRCFRVRVF